MEHIINTLKDLQMENGLFVAAPNQGTGYNKVWIRDTTYSSIGIESHDPQKAVGAMHGILDIFRKHEWKIDHIISGHRPKYAYEYLHARYDPKTLGEFWEEWGNKQNDMIGAFLFRCAELMDRGYFVFRDHVDLRVIRKLVSYLEVIEYWHDPDNGMWEEAEELHASSIGACLAGLKAMAKYINVPEHLIVNGKNALETLLPAESATKKVDLALLSLIYPYRIVRGKMAAKILENIERKLVRKRGVIRYPGDQYYNNGKGEAEWTMGLPWLALIYREMGNRRKYNEYMRKSKFAMCIKGFMPELWLAETDVHNTNSPLSWSQSLYIAAAVNA